MSASTETLHAFWAAFVDHVCARLFTPPDEFGERDCRVEPSAFYDIDAIMRRGLLLVQKGDAAAVARLCKSVDEAVTEAFKAKAWRMHLFNVVAAFRFATEAARSRLDDDTADEVLHRIEQAFEAADNLRVDEVDRLLGHLRTEYRLDEEDPNVMFNTNLSLEQPAMEPPRA